MAVVTDGRFQFHPADVEALNVMHLPDRKQPVLVAVVHDHAYVLARFVSGDATDVFMALAKRGMAAAEDE